MYNLLNETGLEKLKNEQPERFSNSLKTGAYLNLQKLELANLDGIDIPRLEKLANIMRGLIFATVEAGQSGHPGGSSSKVEQTIALTLGGSLAFDPLDPKNVGRDRVIWSAGHCTPALFSLNALLYESLRRIGRQFSTAVIKTVFPEDLIRFRRIDGPTGHVESYYPLADTCTGPSGHGLSGAGGMAITHLSCGLPTKFWVFMGDAESEEGMTYEARNILASVGAKNLIVSLDYNHFGIDGDINEVISSDYINHWLGLGWNVIEVDGHNILELIYAYRLAAKGFDNNSPTVVLAHGIKGKKYGTKENTADSHGTPAKHEEYVEIMKNLGFNIPGEIGKPMLDIETVLENLDEVDTEYVNARLEVAAENILPETKLEKTLKETLTDRPLINPLTIKRPKKLPKELTFTPGEKVATRKAASAWFEWLMKQTAFFYAGSGDLSKSVLTSGAEKVYGIINHTNPTGRGIRFGIAEQNMAMMSTTLTQDILPGGFRPISVFGSYAVFSTMTGNCVRLSLIANKLNPEHKGFFIMLAAHDGPETGEDGPTHQGLYWMSLYSAMPGIKVYKPMDAAETIEMLFYALEKGEPIALSLLRPDTPVLDRSIGNSKPEDANNGAYIYYETANSFFRKSKNKIILVISGVNLLLNVMQILPELEKKYSVKIVNVTSPQLFEALRRTEPKKAQEIFSDEDRKNTITLHNGWKGFLAPFLLPADHETRSIGIDTYLKSGNVEEMYELAELTSEDIKNKILKLKL